MLRITELKLPLDHNEAALRSAAAARLEVGEAEIGALHVARRGYDARRRSAVSLVYSLDVALRDESTVLARPKPDPRITPTPDIAYHQVAHAPATLEHRPIVVGAGPCGLFAALILAQMGFRPIILDRGKVVRERTKDTWGLWRRGVLTPNPTSSSARAAPAPSPTASSRAGSRTRFTSAARCWTEFVAAGAPEEILYGRKPHIGTFRLVTVVEGLRAQIEALGGEYRFGTRVDGIDIAETPQGRQLRGAASWPRQPHQADHVVLAIGHSARDTFAMLDQAASSSSPNPSRSACASSIRNR